MAAVSVPMKILGEAIIAGTRTPVAYMCYAESRSLSNWTAEGVEKSVNSVLGSSQQVIVIIDTTGATDVATDPRIINKLYPDNLYLGIWIRSPDFQGAFNEFKKKFGKGGKVHIFTEQDEFADELKELLQKKNITFPSGLIDSLAQKIKSNA